MKLAIPLILAAPIIASAVAPRPPPPDPVEVIPSPGGGEPPKGGAGVVVRAPWRSAALIAAVQELQRKPLVPYTRTEGLVTCGQAVLRAQQLPRPRNVAWPAIPRWQVGELVAAYQRILAALEAGQAAQDPGSRGGFALTPGGEWIAEAAAMKTIRDGELANFPLSPLGRAARSAFWGLDELQRVTPRQTNQYVLGSHWRTISYLAEWMDTTGAPLFGEKGFGGVGAAVESLYVGVQIAEGAAADAAVAAGGAIAGVAGDATWALIASPVGLVAAGALLLWIYQ